MLISDMPIQTPDEDVLGRKIFTENLSKTIIEYNRPEGIVIGIHGKWGSGKTSVVNMVIKNFESMDHENPPIILRFNPWLCYDQTQLVTQFFKQLSSEIKINRPKLVSICEFLDDYADIFEVIPVAGKLISTMVKKKASESKSKNDNLQTVKNNISDALRKEQLKIVVTIDDIDRLSNTDIVAIFQLVKSLADFPYTIYLLTFDWDIVISALADVQKANGAEYLEKIIQVPFELPAPKKGAIHHLFLKKLEEIINDVPENKWDKDEWINLFHYGFKKYLTSIRDVIRYLNVFNLKYTLLKAETYPIDLIALTCIQVFEPAVYSILQAYQDSLCGGEGHTQYDYDNKHNEDVYNVLISKARESRKEDISVILCMLFPRLKKFKKNDSLLGSWNTYNHLKSLQNANICNPKCFQRYFALSLEDEDISIIVLEDMIFNLSEEQLTDSINKINNSQNISDFLEYVCAIFDQLKEQTQYTERAKLLFKTITSLYHTFKDKRTGFLIPSIYHYLILCTKACLQILNKEERFIVVKGVFENKNIPLSTLIIYLGNFENQHGRFVDENRGNEEPLLEVENLIELEKILSYRLIKEVDNNTLFNNNNLIYILWIWKQIETDVVQENIVELIKSDSNLIKLVSSSVSLGKGSNMSGSTFDIWNVDTKNLSDYVDIGTALDRVLNFVETTEFDNLDEKICENIAAFIISQEARSEFGGITIDEVTRKLNEISKKKENTT